jgi:hypothetical protein
LLSGVISTSFTVVVPATPVFSNLSVSSSIAQGTASVTFSGNIAAGALIPPSSESVSVTLHGVTQQTPINAQGNFTTTFNTTALPTSNSPYQIVYTYNGDGNFTSVMDNTTTTLLVMQNNGTEEPVWRLFSPITKEHLYTADPNEVSTLVTRGWTQEGGVFYYVYTGLDTINGVTDVPMYRLYDIVNQQHLYTTDSNEYNTLKDFVGTWSVDGVFGYIFPTPYPGSAGDPGSAPHNPTTLASVPNSTALYRLSYPFVADLHLLTIDQNEWNTDALVYGWTKEGIIGYVLSS